MSDGGAFWREMEARGPDAVVVAGTTLRRGSRVRLRPRPRGDVLDIALDGRIGVVEAAESDDGGEVHLAVTLEDDPGRDLGDARMPGHRFFFRADEVEPLEGEAPRARRVLVAGVGNVFLGDDGFGVAVANRLLERDRIPGVDVVDFGIRGMDLAFALHDGYDAVVIVDAAPRGEPPGTLSVIEPEADPDAEVAVEGHGMDPARVLALARAFGASPPPALVVACEPESVVSVERDEDLRGELSAPVAAAVGAAVELVEQLVRELLDLELAERRGPT